MLKILKCHKPLFAFLIAILFGGIVNAYFSIFICLLAGVYFVKNNKLNDLFTVFVFLLFLSDNYNYSFASFIKPVFIILLFAYLYIKKRLDISLFKWFVPFFIVAAICLLDSFSFLTSFQKTLSYALILIITPSFIRESAKGGLRNKQDLVQLFVALNTCLIALGLLLQFVGSGVVSMRGGRPGGLLGNSNGLGIFCLLTISLLTVVYHFYPNLFSRCWKIGSYCVVIIALLLTASRGGILSTAVFLSLYFVFVKRKYILAFFGLVTAVFAFSFLPSATFSDSDQEGIVNYLRLNQEDVTSGRDIAWELATEEINNGNYWLSKGMGYSEFYMQQIATKASKLGHQGNVHNSYLTIWLDVGLVGLIFFVFAWLACFYQVRRQWRIVLPILGGLIISTNVESWLAASLNPFTVYVLILLTLLGSIKKPKKKALLQRKAI